MSKRLLTVCILYILHTTAHAQDTTLVSRSSLFLGLGNDSYYGSYFYALGFYTLTAKTSVAAFALSRGFQAGAGFKFSPSESLMIVPLIGLSNGKALAGGDHPVLAEGVTPSLLFTYSTKRFILDEGSIYYKAIQKKGPVSSDYLWYWLTGGIKLSKKITAGIHYENLLLTRTTQGSATSIYRYIGPYLQADFLTYSHLRLTTGFEKNKPELIRLSLFAAIAE